MSIHHRGSIRIRTVALAVLAGSIGFSSSAQALILGDGVFNPANWSGQAFVTGTSTASATTSLSGGVPDEYRDISNTSSGSPLSGWDRSLFVDLNTTAVANPASLGGINLIDYSEDHRCVCIGGGMMWGPALEQGGQFYIVPGNAMPNSFTLPWQNEALTALTAADFEEVSVTSTTWTNPASHPDFSASGAPITFGYVRAKAFIGATESYLDNWSVAIDELPVDVEELNWGTAKSTFR
ncbi:hypothetical protein COW53_00740 [bacterium CG17_big_fil_post_rev_8_21_14_2_50_64_8]|nr:MAG: hypothetical protein COW53_00740 [bacterium CG17_big_fil_post_rev_8_21_14_2_50_64_8]PJA74265.1 MAG: hypothetical protein CO151_10210 [bacterium CG_4_9_14_3_um_filter_65_15]